MNSTRPPLALFVFIDALGWEIYRKHQGFLGGLLETARPLDTVFGYSSTCDPTIITGCAPREHGHFSFFYYHPETSPFRPLRPLGWLPRALTRRGRVRRVLSRMVKRYYGYTGYFQLYNMPFHRLHHFDYSEKRDIYEPGGINGGQPTIFQELRARHIPFARSDWRKGEEHNLAHMADRFREGRVRFAYLYLAAMDALLHARGTDAPEVGEKMRGYDRQLRELLAVAQTRYRDIHIHVFSDHGMTDTVAECDVMSRIEGLGLRFGRDYAAVFDSTMARFWFLSPGARSRVQAALEEIPEGRILDEATLRAWGVDFPGHTYGELFFLMNPGVLLNPSYMGETRLAGMHGFEPDHRDSVAAYFSNVTPAVVPAGLADLHALMRAEASRVEQAAVPSSRKPSSCESFPCNRKEMPDAQPISG